MTDIQAGDPVLKNEKPRQMAATRLLVGIDCIVFGFDNQELQVLLVQEDADGDVENLSLPGDFLIKGENLAAGIERIVFNLTGKNDVYVEQLEVMSNTHLSVREQKLSVIFLALLHMDGVDLQSPENRSLAWYNMDNIESLRPEQQELVSKGLENIRYKAALHPIGFELLPFYFTVPQMHKLYESIYKTPLDKRNFSKKVLSTGLLLDTGKKSDAGVTNKARLYEVDKEKYKEKFHYALNFIAETIKKVPAVSV